MMISSSHHTREQFEHCLAAIRQASVEILLLLNVHVSEGKYPRWFLERLDSARLNDAEMTAFTLQLRLLQQRVPQYESGQDVSENQLIA
ncbi:STY4199 family HEPN domain-containing protein, partial [Enterobacter hormaechei]|uniref:STY4199 family HEPN domain-containing protein n=1 Tax=Enterobacter hormaechei TaxID=158836 RepID=UPI0020D12D45